jgi:uncharacterized protein YhbP (UPF0306 family)
MSTPLEKIEVFIAKHHVLTLATSVADEVSACSLFYVYDKTTQSFIVASSFDTQHIQNILHNSKVAGNILLETKKVGIIEGLQFRGVFQKLDVMNKKALYFQVFPYAIALAPTLWQINVEEFKLTDNKLGFGKKLLWKVKR